MPGSTRIMDDQRFLSRSCAATNMQSRTGRFILHSMKSLRLRSLKRQAIAKPLSRTTARGSFTSGFSTRILKGLPNACVSTRSRPLTDKKEAWSHSLNSKPQCVRLISSDSLRSQYMKTIPRIIDTKIFLGGMRPCCVDTISAWATHTPQEHPDEIQCRNFKCHRMIYLRKGVWHYSK
jgi:hypothetical protein